MFVKLTLKKQSMQLSDKSCSRSGQTLVEYILVCALVVGGVVAFKDSLIKPLLTILQGTTDAIQEEAVNGGYKKGEQYYQGACGKKGGCR